MSRRPSKAKPEALGPERVERSADLAGRWTLLMVASGASALLGWGGSLIANGEKLYSLAAPIVAATVEKRIQFVGGRPPAEAGFTLYIDGQADTDAFPREWRPTMSSVPQGEGSQAFTTLESEPVSGFGRLLNARQVWLAGRNGWRLSAELRFGTGIAFANVELGQTRYDMHVVRTVEGATFCLIYYINVKGDARCQLVRLPADLQCKSSLVLEPEFHVYELDFTPGSAAKASIDGCTVWSDYRGHGDRLSSPQISWGVSGWDNDRRGSASFHFVRFDIK